MRASVHPSDVLARARELIRTEDRWLQHRFAVDEYGIRVDTWDERACRFCLIGALRRASFEGVGRSHTLPWEAVMSDAGAFVLQAIEAQHGPGWNSAAWNDADRRRHSEVLAVLDHSIRLSADAAVRPEPTH